MAKDNARSADPDGKAVTNREEAVNMHKKLASDVPANTGCGSGKKTGC